MKLKKDQHILSKMKKRIIEKVFISVSSGFIGRNLYNFLKKEYLILKPSRNIIDLRNKKKLNSNSKLKRLFPKIMFSNFYKCLKKTLKYEKLI